MVEVVLTKEQKKRLWSHLMPRRYRVEEVAFLFTNEESVKDSQRLVCQDMWLLGPDDLTHQSAYHIEFSDETRAKLIKKAHDTQTSLVEIHSHLGDRPACFSGSDLSGFNEWVPHVRWRLKGRTYAALVVTRSDFDGFVWRSDMPERIKCLVVGKRGVLYPNGRSPFPMSLHVEAKNE